VLIRFLLTLGGNRVQQLRHVGRDMRFLPQSRSNSSFTDRLMACGWEAPQSQNRNRH